MKTKASIGDSGRAAPGQIATMAELRREIDAVDQRLVALLAARVALIDRAVELKPGEGLPARIPARIDEVLGNVRAAADAAGLDGELAERLWREMIEWSIRREERRLDRSGAA